MLYQPGALYSRQNGSLQEAIRPASAQSGLAVQSDRQLLVPVASMHWLTLQFRDASHEQAYRQHALAGFVWVDFLLGLVALGIYTGWAATDYERWKAALATSLGSWPAAQQLLDLHTPAQQHTHQSSAAGGLQDVCSASGDPRLIAVQSYLLTGMISCIMISAGICLLKGWLILFDRRRFFQSFTAVMSVDWWCTKLLSLGAGIAYCTLLTPGMACGVIMWLAAYLAVATSLRLPFQRSLLYTALYSVLWSALWLTFPLTSSRRFGARQQLSIAVFVLGLQYVVETGGRVYYARVVASTAAGTPQSTTAAAAADPESSDCDDDPPEVADPADPADPVMIYPISSKSLQHQQEMPEEHAEQHSPHSSNPGARRRSSHAVSTAAEVAAAAAAAVASTSTAAAEAVTADGPTVIVAALPAVGESGHEGLGRRQLGASLVYESPLLHRTIGVKVFSTSGLSRGLAASRLATSVQAALDSLPQGARVVDRTEQVVRPNTSGAGPSRPAPQAVPRSDAVMVSRVLVPGCVMLLGTVVTRRQQVGQQQQRSTAAAYFSDEIWHLQLSGGACCSCNGSDSSYPPAVPFKYSNVLELEGAISDGSFAANIQAWLDGTAAAANASEDFDISQEQYVVCSFGSDLRVLLQGSAQSAAASDAAKRGCSCKASSLRVRLVVAKGNTVIADEQHELQQVTTGYQTRAKTSSCSNMWQLQQQLPSSLALGGRPLSNPATGCVLTLHLLSPQLSDSDSSGTMDSSSGADAAAAESGQYASITALLLPHTAAAEVQAWIQQTRMSQKFLQPLLRDMAVALQAAGLAAAASTTGHAAVAAEWLDGAATAEDRSVLTAAIAASAGDAVHALRLPNSHWSTAAEAARRAQQYLAAQGMTFGSNIMGDCVQQLLQMGSKGVPNSTVLATAEKRAAGAAEAAVNAAVHAMKAKDA